MVPGWIDAIDAEVWAAMAGPGPFTPGELAKALRISEPCAVQYIRLLADAGRLRIEAAALLPRAGAGVPPPARVGRAA